MSSQWAGGPSRCPSWPPRWFGPGPYPAAVDVLMEGSAVSLGPTALAARDRLLAELPGPGARVGAERELAERLGVSRSTIRAALGDLERTGVIRRGRGRGGGVFVADPKVQRGLTSPARLPAHPRPPGFPAHPPGP